MIPVALPRVLAFSEGVLSLSHGTGTIFSRNFSFYPVDRVQNWFICDGSNPLLATAHDLNECRWRKTRVPNPSKLASALWNRLGLMPRWAAPVNSGALAGYSRTHAFRPDIVYAIPVSREGIDSLRGVLDGLPNNVPLVVHFHDFSPSVSVGFWRALRRLRHRITEVWGVSPGILAEIQAQIPGIPVRFDPNFYLTLPPLAKEEHRTFDAAFRAVILGNLWNPSLLRDVRAIWRTLQQRHPGLLPISWHCHASGIARVQAAGVEPCNEVTPAPFLRGDELFSALRSYDLAILPFSRAESPETDYERYSMPSRTTELCAAGLPIICLAGKKTPIGEYLVTNGIGDAAPSANTAGAAQLIESFLLDRDKRDRFGRAARRFAEENYQLAPFQDWLARKFIELSTARCAPQLATSSN